MIMNRVVVRTYQGSAALVQQLSIDLLNYCMGTTISSNLIADNMQAIITHIDTKLLFTIII